MKTIGLAAMLLAALLTTPASAGPPFPERCCACLPESATTGGAGRQEALFCVEVLTPEQDMAFTNQCGDLHGAPLCVIPLGDAKQVTDNIDCTALLGTEGITCPGHVAAPAPLLASGALAGLALGLGGLGAWSFRRRRGTTTAAQG